MTSLLEYVRRNTEQVLAYLVLAITLGIMANVVAESIGSTGYLSAWDAGGHLLKAKYFAEELLPFGHLSGWFPLWHGGFDLFQFYPPLLYYLLGPLTLVVNDELALRLMTAGLWLGLVPVTYYFLRSFHLNRLIAALGTSFLLGLNASFGIGLGALYGVGLLPNGLGFIMAIWALGRLKREITEPERSSRQLVLTGLIVGLLVLSHTFSAYWWGLASVLLIGIEMFARPRDRVAIAKRFGLVLLIGLLVSAYWWVPLALNIDHMGPTGKIQQLPRPTIFENLVFAKDSGGPVMALLGLGGLVSLGLGRRWKLLGFFGGLLVLSLLLSLDTINDFLPFGSVIGSSQFIRFHAFFSWLLMVAAVFGLAGIWRLIARIKVPYFAPAVAASVTSALFTIVILPTLDLKRGFINVVNTGATAEVREVGAVLDQRLRPGEFVLSEFNWDARYYFGSPHFVNQRLPMTSNLVADLDGNFLEGTRGATRPVEIASFMDDTLYLSSQQDYLLSRGIRYIVTTHPNTRVRLSIEPWLTQVHSGKTLSIFELKNFRHRFGLPPELASKLESVDYAAPGHYRLRFSEPVTIPAGTTLALSYHPWLKVQAGTAPVPTTTDEDYRLRLDKNVALPGRELDITYQPAGLTRLASVVSVLSLLGVAGLLLTARWARPLALVRTVRRRGPGRARRRGRRAGR